MVGAGPAERICAIVVTFNRAELLAECLTRLGAQTRPPDEILVVDNASTDGTADVVAERFPEVTLLRLPENVGGAGGFHAGMRDALARGHDWLWVMDDDTFTVPDTLEQLLAGGARARGGAPMMLSSQVRWKDETLHPMNLPSPRWRDPAFMALGAADGLVGLRNATFVSVALHRDAIERYGLPLAHYFIWTDDVELTSRIMRAEPGYLVPESRVYHWTPTAHPAAASSSGDRFYYHVRNSLLLLRGTSLAPMDRIDYARYYVKSLLSFLRERGREPAALKLLARGLRDGVRGDVR
ncbi:MAG: glycosyltransferase family 2 protein [Baekduiaceae bacterium]